MSQIRTLFSYLFSEYRESILKDISEYIESSSAQSSPEDHGSDSSSINAKELLSYHNISVSKDSQINIEYNPYDWTSNESD